ncbi:response regulator [Leucobacter allii]|uniref:response regulator n=1 Tax=Leucobacter allii TaxID=2932247 RepID=UPI001FD42CE9|nr:response regulator [Leucobacter allii]UOR01299.1 response regulator [Leucobacter allii]
MSPPSTTTPVARAPRPARRGVAVVEDHLMQRRYTESLVDAQPDLQLVHSAETLPEFVGWYERAERRPQLLLLDLLVERGPAADPATVARLARSGLKIVVFSAMSSPPLVRRVAEAGAQSFVGKRDTERELLAAIRATLDGRAWRSPEFDAVVADAPPRPRFGVQEERALTLYASGMTLAEVAAEIGVQPGTAKKYLHRVRAKYAELGRPVRSRLEMLRAATQDGFVPPPA